MNLDVLLARIVEIDVAIANTTNQLNILYGHKNETQHWVNQIRTGEAPAPEEAIPQEELDSDPEPEVP